mgnify:CR=1 FL=1
MNTRTETLTPAQIEEIRRNDPEAEIYNVEYADVDYVPMDDLKRMMGTIRGIAKSLRDENPGWSDDQVRKVLASPPPQWSDHAVAKAANLTVPSQAYTRTAFDFGEDGGDEEEAPEKEEPKVPFKDVEDALYESSDDDDEEEEPARRRR